MFHLNCREDDASLLAIQEGAEIEVFAAAGNGSSNGRDVGLPDQGVTGDYEVQVAGGRAMVWQ